MANERKYLEEILEFAEEELLVRDDSNLEGSVNFSKICIDRSEPGARTEYRMEKHKDNVEYLKIKTKTKTGEIVSSLISTREEVLDFAKTSRLRDEVKNNLLKHVPGYILGRILQEFESGNEGEESLYLFNRPSITELGQHVSYSLIKTSEGTMAATFGAEYGVYENYDNPDIPFPISQLFSYIEGNEKIYMQLKKFEIFNKRGNK